MVAQISQLISVATDLIHEWEHNPRKTFDEKKLAALADNIAVAGQIHALLVRAHPQKEGHYQLADGARRLRALRLKKIGMAEIRIRALTDEEMLDIALSTGGEGGSEPLTPLDEAHGYAEAKEIFKTSERGVAERLGKPLALIQKRLALLELPEESKRAVTAGELPPETAWLIARIPTAAHRAEAERGVLHGQVGGGVMPFAVAKKFIEERICRSLRGAPFDKEDATLAPDAGKCSGCRFRSGNNVEVYGTLGGGDDKCMNPACFEAKVAAARARLLAKEATAGKEPLAKEVNDLIFPKTEKGLSYKSEYVAWTQPITRDLLKPEVARVPTWTALCARPDVKVKVYVGIDQDGRAIDVAKLGEALAAVPADEVAIFAEDVVRKHGLKLAKSAAKSASIAAEEEEDRKLRERAQRAAKNRDKKARKWLEEVVTYLEGFAAGGRPAWGGYAYWSLMFELMLKALGDEDLVFVCELFEVEEMIGQAKPPREALTDFVGRISKDRCAALVTAMTLAPWLRAEGPDAAFVTQWHDAFLAEKPAEPGLPEAAPAPVPKISKQESATLALLVKAYDGGVGMSPQRCAAEFKMSLEEVCGALEIDERAARNVVTQLRQECEEAFAAAPIRSEATKNRMTKFACAGVPWAELTQPEQFRALLRVLSQKLAEGSAN